MAGFDVIEHPMEVKRRIGYLPETPPLYPEMEVSEYLRFVGKLKGISSADIGRRVDEVTGRCALGDVRNKLISKLSKGYRQRVGLAAGHHPQSRCPDPRRAHFRASTPSRSSKSANSSALWPGNTPSF